MKVRVERAATGQRERRRQKGVPRRSGQRRQQKGSAKHAAGRAAHGVTEPTAPPAQPRTGKAQ